MIKNNRFLALFLAIMIIFLQLPMDALAEGGSILVKDVSHKPTSGQYPVEKGGGLELSLELKNTIKDLEEAQLTIPSNSNFSVNGTSSRKISFGENGTSKLVFKLIYQGGDNSLPLEISYKANGKEATIKTSALVDNLKESSPAPSPADKDNSSSSDSSYVRPSRREEEEDNHRDEEPNLALVSNKTQLIRAGEETEFKFTVKNTSDVRAENISVSLDLEDSMGLIIKGAGYESIRSLRPGAEEDLSFKVVADKFAEEKNHSVKLKFHFYNRGGKSFTETDNLYLRVQGDGADSQLIVNDVIISPIDDINPGSPVLVTFDLKNLSPIPVRDINASLAGLETNGITLSSGTNKFTVPMLKGNSSTLIRFPLKTSGKLKPGNYPLKLNVNYKNLRGQALTEEHEFFIPIKGSSLQNSSLIIENIKSPSVLGPNSTGVVSFDVRNRGQNVARDVKVVAELPDTELVAKSVTTIKFDELAPGEKKNVQFSFLATKKTPTKNYPINIKIDHVDDFSEGDDRYGLEQFLGIFVDNPELDKEAGDGKKSTPKLILDKYTFSSDMVEAGKNFDMKLSFYNTNSSKAVKNIKIFLTAEPNIGEGDNSPGSGSSVFTPVNSSNTFYIDSIPPKGRVEKSITMFTIPDAAAKTHIITANFEYEDGEFDEYKATELIGVPVVQKSKLEVAELNYMKDVFVHDPVSVSAEFYNTGKSTLYNMMVRLEGNFDMENASYYIGNFAPGTSEHFDGTVIPTQPGELEGEVVFSFEDSTGEEQEIRRPFTMTVGDMPMDDFTDDLDMPEEKGFFAKFKWPLIAGAGIVAGFFGRRFYKKKKQEKEDKDLLSDE